MGNVKMTVKQIKDLGLWEKVCDYKGINPWGVNEGLIDYDDIIEFDTEFKVLNTRNIKDFLEDRYEYVEEIKNKANKLYYKVNNSKDQYNGCELAKIVAEINDYAFGFINSNEKCRINKIEFLINFRSMQNGRLFKY